LTYEQFRTLDGHGERVILRIVNNRRVDWRVSGERRTWYGAHSRIDALIRATDVIGGGKSAAELRWRRTVPRLPEARR